MSWCLFRLPVKIVLGLTVRNVCSYYLEVFGVVSWKYYIYSVISWKFLSSSAGIFMELLLEYIKRLSVEISLGLSVGIFEVIIWNFLGLSLEFSQDMIWRFVE